MKIYKIRDWSKLFENNRSRTVERLAWVAIPNRHDGENYSALITSKDGAELFAAWCLIVQVASKCSPRGTLLKGDGKPHDAGSLALKTRAPEKWFDKCLNYLSANTDWLDVEDIAGQTSGGCQSPDSQVAGDRQSGDDEGKEGTEQNGTEKNRTASGGVVIPQGLSTPQFLKEWDKWVDARKAMGKKPKEWAPMFQEQIDWLNSFGAKTAIEMISASIRNNWQGIFESRNGKPSPSKPESRQIEETFPPKLL